MNQQEADEVIGRLSTRMREVGLGWVVDSAAEEIRLGREVSRSEPIPMPGSKRALKPSVDSLTTVPLTPDEQVGVLVEAIRRSVVDVAYLEVAVVASFSSDPEASDVDTGEVVFVSPAGGDGDGDTDGRDRVALRLGADGLSPQRQEAAAALAELLDRLTEGVDVAR